MTATFNPGRYYLRVDGVGNNTNSDYSDFASTGMFFIEGSVPMDGAPNEKTANFAVGISYSDNNSALVRVELHCANGNVNATQLYASPGNAAVFEVTGFSGDPKCAASEEVPGGYIGDESDCQNVPLLAAGECTIVNVADEPSPDMIFSGGFERG